MPFHKAFQHRGVFNTELAEPRLERAKKSVGRRREACRSAPYRVTECDCLVVAGVARFSRRGRQPEEGQAPMCDLSPEVDCESEADVECGAPGRIEPAGRVSANPADTCKYGAAQPVTELPRSRTLRNLLR